jgi:hypothetical protein
MTQGGLPAQSTLREGVHLKVLVRTKASEIAGFLITREFPTWEGGGESRAPSVARLVL